MTQERSINAGDLVYYDLDSKRRWCVVFSIEGTKVWGKWEDSVEDACAAAPSRGSYVPLRLVHFDRRDKTLDDLEVGDIIVDTDSNEAKVLAVLGDVFLKSSWNNYDETASWLTISEAKSAGLTVKQDTPTDEITELSIAELEQKLDLTAGTLRVKKD